MIPDETLRERLCSLSAKLRQAVIGQDDAIATNQFADGGPLSFTAEPEQQPISAVSGTRACARQLLLSSLACDTEWQIQNEPVQRAHPPSRR